jgi:hypothetical protein
MSFIHPEHVTGAMWYVASGKFDFDFADVFNVQLVDVDDVECEEAIRSRFVVSIGKLGFHFARAHKFNI